VQDSGKRRFRQFQNDLRGDLGRGECALGVQLLLGDSLVQLLLRDSLGLWDGGEVVGNTVVGWQFGCEQRSQ
jgi:hypothetical protein